jgi:exopolyphosphatase/guanosine-5'-triphosphate,3'-diphosphate pyrophosphatase
MLKVALIDVGSNSIHLIIAEVQPDFSYKIIDRHKNVARLGDDTFKTGLLSPEAIVRGTEVMRNFIMLARNRGVTRIQAVATSAVREATNGGDLIEAVERDSGVRIRVVTGLEEARLIYLGVRQSMDFGDRRVFIADFGGGSVELIIGTRQELLHAASLKLGAIRLNDLYLKGARSFKDGMEQLGAAIEGQLKTALPRFKKIGFDEFVATSGMIGNLAEVMYQHNTGRPLPQLNLTRFPYKDVAAVEKLLAGTPLARRTEIPGLDPSRADLLLPASMVLRRIMERPNIEELIVSDKGIRDGLLADFMELHREGIQAEGEIPNLRRREVIRLARKCQYEMVHAHHVAKLSLQLFDQTKSLHKMADQEREWLEFAAILHDIGFLINSRQHHKHAYYLIKNSDLAGFTSDEIELIGNVARYHRKATPEEEHRTLKNLDSDHREKLAVLAGILRIANALDRSHFSVVKSIDCVTTPKTVELALTTTDDAALEVWAARKRSDLLADSLQRPITLTTRAAGEAEG